MGIGPTQSRLKMEQILNAWKTLAPEKSFAGLTLEQFEAAAKPAQDATALLEEMDDQRLEVMNQRDDGYRSFFAKADRVVNAVRADQTEGADGTLYEAMGYTRTSDRKSGLTRKKQNPQQPAA